MTKPYRFVLTFLFCTLAASTWADQRVYTLNTSYSPPHSTEHQTGYLDLIVKEAFRRAGYRAEIQMMPAERCLQDANAGISDGDIGRIRNMDDYYPNLVLVDEPVIESRDFVAFSIHKDFRTDDWESLAPYHVGIPRGWKIFESNVAGTQPLIKMDSTRALFKLLKNDRAEVVLNARIDGLYTARQLGIKNIRVMEPPLASLELYLFLHKKNREIIPRIEAALKAMKADGTFYDIRNRVLAATIGR
jgi:polar amino acid transport system substrate-binding protein